MAQAARGVAQAERRGTGATSQAARRGTGGAAARTARPGRRPCGRIPDSTRSRRSGCGVGGSGAVAQSRGAPIPRTQGAPQVKIAVIGLGYVGLPLAMVFADAGVAVVGIETSAPRCEQMNARPQLHPGRRRRRPRAAWSTRPDPRHARLRRHRRVRRASSSACPRRSTRNREPDLTHRDRTARASWPGTCGAASS